MWQDLMVADEDREQLIERAVAEVDRSLLDWYRELSMFERLRAAGRATAFLERMARAARDR